MKIYKLKDMERGWFIGDFEPSVLKSADFEVAYLYHHAGQEWPSHFHSKAIEYNLLVKGKMRINGIEIKEKDIFVIDKNEVAEPEFLENCEIVCVKVPSVKNDKFNV